MDAVAEVRAFNRFYTEVIGVLGPGMHDSPYSLTEARVLYELGQAPGPLETGEIRRPLGIDAGYLSRVLTRLETDGMVTRERAGHDARRQVVSLTGAGRATYTDLDRKSAAQVAALIDGADLSRLLASMTAIREILGGAPRSDTVVIRAPRPGDLGWVVQRHAAIYVREQGWGAEFEALVARICADFLDHRDDPGQAGWIAEVDGRPAGCVLCVRGNDEGTAQLRLLLVEPWARGRGVGARLVEECLRFAADAGYTRIRLWTRDVLTSARRIYQAAGFEVTGTEQADGFVDEIWERDISGFTDRN
ncbi:bifunctional helix-turn-helix transcriptional regulator/GNAT family N-acetyltransferase [Herbidospora cretacea]|uniref:bifunctional helix-turn-helix transcriptional regulator/GNAT family N-acetyltransferase n=1 Tax=Herbidospora cretacea TaxID=28444 RepID=UPI0007739733|nr:helix-turn-helix domain-containing GNAT family N-acetyltransferase [Herbidospora cretacea]